MLTLGSSALATTSTPTAAGAGSPSYYYRWTVELYHRSGGLKRQYYIGQDNNPIIGVSFELNLKGCGSGTLTFAYLDVPIDADDYVKIYYQGTLKYYGVVDIAPDPKGGEVQLIPIWNKLQERLHNEAFSGKTVSQIMQTVTEALDQDTGILWNAIYIDTGSSTTYTITYSYEQASKIFDDLVDGRLTNRYWGVYPTGYLYIQPYGSSVAKALYYGDSPAYTDITVEKDYQGIEATRYQVLKKTSGAAGTATRIGQVGYGAPYPTLAVENLVRIKEDKITAPEVLSDTLALDWAYAKLQAQSVKQTITLNNVNLDLYFPTIGELITCQDTQNKVEYTVVTCESTSGWTGASLDTTNYVEGSASVTATMTAIGQKMIYSFSGQKIFYWPERLGLMLRATQSGQWLRVNVVYDSDYVLYGYGSGIYSDASYSDGDSTGTPTINTTTSWTLNISAASVWQFFDMTSTSPIAKIEIEAFAAVPTGSAAVNVDRIQIFGPYRNVYTDNVVQANFEITPESEIVTVKMNNYDPKASQTLFDLEEQVRILEAVSAI